MNYINLLTQEEKYILCEIITGKKFKELFKENESDFTKIRKGFRAKTLTEQEALSIAKLNVNKPFIAMFVNNVVDNCLKDIKKNIERFETKGSTYDVALATAVLDSAFADNVNIYFKLVGKDLDIDSCYKLCKKMMSIKFERVISIEVDNRIKDIEEENRRLLNQIEVAQQSIGGIKSEYEQKIKEIEQDKNTLEILLSEERAKVTELQTSSSVFKNDDEYYLKQFDDTKTSILPSSNTDKIVSLCCIKTDYSGKKQLLRYADLNYNGKYDIFYQNEDSSPYFENRDKIYYKDGPSEDGFYGIWNWSAVENRNDPNRDYIFSEYNKNIDAIEIVIVKDITTIDDLINLLKEGINYMSHSKKTIFSFSVLNGKYIGVLFKHEELNIVNGKTSFNKSCNVVPVYEFYDEDIINLKNEMHFYKKAFLGVPNQLYYLKNKLDIIQEIIKDSISWKTYKKREFTKDEHRKIKNLIGEIPVNNIISKIASECFCSDYEAKNLCDEFLSLVNDYIDGKSFEDKIISSAISVNTELQEKTKELLLGDWKKENESLLSEAQKKLDSLNAEIKSTTESLSELQEVINKSRLEEKHITASIVERKKLAEDIERAVSEKIERARENVADFIASMLFVSGEQAKAVASEISATGEILSETDIIKYHTFSEYEDFNDLEAHHSWTDVINTVVYELGEAGIAQQYRTGLAAFLCAAYIEKQPLLLVGPNAIDIVQAFSAAVTAHKYGVLCCEDSYSNCSIAEIGANGEDIVIINNLFASNWINRLPEIFSKKDIFYVVTHPYAEDIQVEPKSLYGFMLPLFTEFVVDKKATGKYYGGYFADDFKTYSAPKGSNKELRGLSKFPLSPLVRNRINNLAFTMKGIYSNITADDEFLFVVLPIAYVSMSMNELTEIIADSKEGMAISANLKRRLQYVLGEV